MTTAEFDIHPDMADVIAAKRAVTQSNDPEELRAAWNAYGARLARDRPRGSEPSTWTWAGATTSGTGGRRTTPVPRR